MAGFSKIDARIAARCTAEPQLLLPAKRRVSCVVRLLSARPCVLCGSSCSVIEVVLRRAEDLPPSQDSKHCETRARQNTRQNRRHHRQLRHTTASPGACRATTARCAFQSAERSDDLMQGTHHPIIGGSRKTPDMFACQAHKLSCDTRESARTTSPRCALCCATPGAGLIPSRLQPYFYRVP